MVNVMVIGKPLSGNQPPGQSFTVISYKVIKCPVTGYWVINFFVGDHSLTDHLSANQQEATMALTNHLNSPHNTVILHIATQHCHASHHHTTLSCVTPPHNTVMHHTTTQHCHASHHHTALSYVTPPHSTVMCHTTLSCVTQPHNTAMCHTTTQHCHVSHHHTTLSCVTPLHNTIMCHITT